jgi:hypothetical protein
MWTLFPALSAFLTFNKKPVINIHRCQAKSTNVDTIHQQKYFNCTFF